jgi:hypothetical protein
MTIFGDLAYGPRFGSSLSADLSVSKDFRTPDGLTYSNLGGFFANDTGISGHLVLTGAREFTVEQIEVFEVI